MATQLQCPFTTRLLSCVEVAMLATILITPFSQTEGLLNR